MNDKYAKEIAKELRLIRIELQKTNSPIPNEIKFNTGPFNGPEETLAGDKVTIK